MGRIIENLELTGIHSSGKAIGIHNGKNIFVPFGIPGDTVNVELNRRQQGFYSGTITKLEISSSARLASFCQHNAQCGGCNWQNIRYNEQLTLKRQILANALLKYQIETPPIPLPVASPLTTGYRNKIEYAFSDEGINTSEKNVRNVLGFHPFNRRDVVIDIEECFLQAEPSHQIAILAKQTAIEVGLSFYNYNARAGCLRNLIIRSTSTSWMVIVGFTSEDIKISSFLELFQKQIPANIQLLYTILTSAEKAWADGPIIKVNKNDNGTLNEFIGPLNYRISPRAFFQPNTLQAFAIYEKIKEFGNFNGTEHVYDLYTGAGTIACYIAKYVKSIIGIEGSADAIADANINATQNGIQNAQFICGDVLQTFNNKFVEENGKPDVVILDPPRSGTLIEIKRTIIQSTPLKIIYVSCNPVSLAFDLSMLTDGYKITQIQLFDMFPHTHHLETLVLLERI